MQYGGYVVVEKCTPVAVDRVCVSELYYAMSSRLGMEMCDTVQGKR